MSSRHTIALSIFGFFIPAFGVFGYIQMSPQLAFIVKLAEVENCMRKSAAVECAQPLIKQMLEEKSGAEIMRSFDSKLSAVTCHYVGHIVGQQSYKKHKSVDEAISQCDSSCESACEHGVVGQAFAEELGFEESDFDLEHLSPDDIRTVGKRLCTSSQPCHGVGHTLFQSYQSFVPALNDCKNISVDKTAPFCYSGVFMEYGDAMTSKTVRPLHAVPYPSSEELDSFCLRDYEISQRRACFQYLPRILGAVQKIEDSDLAIARVESICGSYVGYDRSACYAGIGSSNSYKLVDRMGAAREKCDSLPKKTDRAACNLGSVGVDVQSRPEVVFKYCSYERDPVLKEMCYRGIFYKLARRDGDIPGAAQKYCDGAPACLAATKSLGSDPWQEIEAKFGGN